MVVSFQLRASTTVNVQSSNRSRSGSAAKRAVSRVKYSSMAASSVGAGQPGTEEMVAEARLGEPAHERGVRRCVRRRVVVREPLREVRVRHRVGSALDLGERVVHRVSRRVRAARRASSTVRAYTGRTYRSTAPRSRCSVVRHVRRDLGHRPQQLAGGDRSARRRRAPASEPTICTRRRPPAARSEARASRNAVQSASASFANAARASPVASQK